MLSPSEIKGSHSKKKKKKLTKRLPGTKFHQSRIKHVNFFCCRAFAKFITRFFDTPFHSFYQVLLLPPPCLPKFPPSSHSLTSSICQFRSTLFPFPFFFTSPSSPSSPLFRSPSAFVK